MPLQWLFQEEPCEEKEDGDRQSALKTVWDMRTCNTLRHLIIFLNRSAPSWGQRSMPDKELSSRAIKMQLDCHKNVIAAAISTLAFTYWV